jgi:anti-anti-sigma factor
MASFKTDNLLVYEAGKLTVVGFGKRNVLDHVNVPQCRDELAKLIRENECEVLAFDLTGVKLIPSGMLGLLASLHKLGVTVMLFNPGEDIKEVLQITKLDQFLEVHEFSLEG